MGVMSVTLCRTCTNIRINCTTASCNKDVTKSGVLLLCTILHCCLLLWCRTDRSGEGSLVQW